MESPKAGNKTDVETYHFVDCRWVVGGVVDGLSSINLLDGDASTNFAVLQRLSSSVLWRDCPGHSPGLALYRNITLGTATKSPYDQP